MSSSEWGPNHRVSGFARKGRESNLFLRYMRMQQEGSHLQAREMAFRKQIKDILISGFSDTRTVRKIAFWVFLFFVFSSHPDCGTLLWQPREIKTNAYKYNSVDPMLGKAEGRTGLNLQTEKRNLRHSGWSTKDNGL